MPIRKETAQGALQTLKPFVAGINDFDPSTASNSVLLTSDARTALGDVMVQLLTSEGLITTEGEAYRLKLCDLRDAAGEKTAEAAAAASR